MVLLRGGILVLSLMSGNDGSYPAEICRLVLHCEACCRCWIRRSDEMVSILCPCYNEEAVLPLFFQRITSVMEGIGEDFEIVCVNDGSHDGTLSLLLDQAEKDGRVCVVDLSRNFGKEAALTAALDHSGGDAVIPIDADLQDPPELIAAMLAKWREG